MKKFISWNVNGLRAVMSKGSLVQLLASEKPDALCLQETKMQEGQLPGELAAVLDGAGYHTYWNYAEKKGYSGTAIFTKEEPLSVRYGMGIGEHDREGRIIALEYPDYWLLTEYVPNSKDELQRLAYRCAWEDDFLAYLKELEKTHPVVFCGDLNVAHEEIDIKNPKTNRGHAGFTDEEREKFSILLSNGFIDTWRYFNPDKADVYSWWSYRFHARENNAGWRIDYFVVSEALKPRLMDAMIYTDVYGSDHCPVGLLMK